MIDKPNFILTFASALGSGLIAGFFLAFSIVVLHGLTPDVTKRAPIGLISVVT